PSEDHFGRTAPSFSPIMKDSASHWVLRTSTPYLQRQRGRACFRQDPCRSIRRSRDFCRHFIHYPPEPYSGMEISEFSALPGSKSQRKITSPLNSITSCQSGIAFPAP